MRRTLMAAWLAGILLMTGCGATRKISQVGLRNPASVPDEAEPASELRMRMQSQLPKACPGPVRQELAWLAQQQVKLPLCPAGFTERVQQELMHFRLEERSFLEEIVGSQCRSLSAEDRQTMLRDMTEALQSTEREDIREGLNVLLLVNLPLERWVVRNGRWVLPEAELERIHALVVQGSCRVDAARMEQSYQTLQVLEELQRLLQDSQQKDRLERFLGGYHKIVDSKVMEFFGGP
ncbi:MAG: hypothetical protein HUU37_06175 [Bdellovibrionales bacterium]|nr:hypothetical protein [Bdellovibrionales bacterium]